MRYFDHLDTTVMNRLFLHRPQKYDRYSDLSTLAIALGATLYIPGVREDLLTTIEKRIDEGVRSLVIDLEDSVHDSDVTQALENSVAALTELDNNTAAQVFVRVREATQISQIISGLANDPGALSGFVLPKFEPDTGAAQLAAVSDAGNSTGSRLLAMPVLETPSVIYRESRDAALHQLSALLTNYREIVPAVRLGATDLCGLFGIRRDRDLTIYDVRLAADFISSVVNYLGRKSSSGFFISGTVWEYFSNHERIFKPQLRSTPFSEGHADELRSLLIKYDLDGLLREVILDRANGLQGKTVIHPSHVPAVLALNIVTHEEYSDACDIMHAPESGGGGVRASGYRNKMNESKPHRNWAEQTLLRANIFGVSNEDITLVDLLSALIQK
ncbi:MAG: HpcH/HpaI aldolase/citrate lyase family protein [Mycobacteriaceae bacterium]